MLSWVLLSVLVAPLPTTSAASVDNAIKAYREGRVSEAKKQLDRAVRADPKCVAAYLVAGQIELRNGYLAAAHYWLEHGLQKAREVGVEDRVMASIMYELALTRAGIAGQRAPLAREQTLAALDATQSAIASGADHPRVYHLQALLHMRLGEIEHADAAFRRCLAVAPGFIPCYADLGNMYVDHGFIEAGFQVLELGVSLGPDSPESWGGLARAQRQTKQLAKAVESFRIALRLAPRSPLLHYEQGLTYAELRSPREAIETLEAFLNLAGPDTPPYKLTVAKSEIERMQHIPIVATPATKRKKG